MSVPFQIGDSRGIIKSLRRTKYPSNGTTAILAVLQYEDGDEEFPVSINLDHSDNKFASRMLPSDTFFFKNYSEGAPFYEALLTAGWIKPTGVMQRTGFVNVPACTLTDKAIIL